MDGALRHVLIMVALTFLPTLELRASIPYGVVLLDGELHWAFVALICIACNILLAPLVWLFVHYVMHIFLQIGFINRIYEWLVRRTQRKVKKYVDRWGVIGLAFFIGVPLPGSGVYSGCLGAYLLDFKFRDYLLASALGCLIAGAVVTAVMVSGSEMLHFMVKDPTHLGG